MTLRRWIGAGLVLALLLTLVPSVAQVAAAPGSSRSRYFPETGRTVSGAFLDYWENNGGLYIYGYPITDEFEDVSTDGNTYLTQYFERAIFEYHPENAGTPYDVLLRLLGLINTQGWTFDPAPEPFYDIPGRLYFPYYGGHSLAEPFLSYWLENGGLPVFGYPLSEQLSQVSPTDGMTYTVQYFERNRFEWHPENAGTPYEVLLGLLGYEYLKDHQPGVDPIVSPTPTVTPTPPPPTATLTPTPTPTPVPVPPPIEGGLHYGFGVQLTSDNINGVFDQVQNAGFGWLRQQVRWADIEPSKGIYNWGFLDQIVGTAAGRGVHVLFSVVAAPAWAGSGMPDDPADLGDFLYALASRYRGLGLAYEVWNEENYAVENNGYVAGAGRYVELLKVAYTRIKQADAAAIVVCGALTPTGTNNPYIAIDDIVYLRQMLEYDGGVIGDYFDVLGAHVAGVNNSPDTLWPDNPGSGPGWVDDPTFYFRHVENIRSTMVAYGLGDKPIWLTEFGWASMENIPAQPARGYEYALQNSEAEQAAYLVRAFEKGRTEYQPWLQGMFVWNLNFATCFAPGDEKSAFGIIRPDGNPRLAYQALVSMPK